MGEKMTDLGEELKELITKGVEEAIEKAMVAMRQSLADWVMESQTTMKKEMGKNYAGPSKLAAENDEGGREIEVGGERTQAKEKSLNLASQPAISAPQMLDEIPVKVYDVQIPATTLHGPNSVVFHVESIKRALTPVLSNALTKNDKERVYNLHENEYGKVLVKPYVNYEDVMNETKVFAVKFETKHDTALCYRSLSKDQELFSSRSESDYTTGIFRLKMQSDFNLVMYPVNTMDTSFNSYWSTATYGIGGVNVTLSLDPDGHLYLLNNSVTILQNLTRGSSDTRRLYLMKIDCDGILGLYSYSLDEKVNSSSVVWEEPTKRCDPKGLFGNNGFCTLIDNNTKANCSCPYGFYYFNKTVGCERVQTYTVEDCKNKEQPFQYSMEPLDNVTWDNEPYPVHKMNKIEDCKTDCLNDSECDAAFYQNGLCLQVQLPLRYGRSVSSDPVIGYIKLASPTPGKKAKDTKSHQSVILVLTAGFGAGLVVMLVFLLVSYWGVRQRQRIKLKENFFKQNRGIMLQQLLHRSESTAERAKIYTEEGLKKATNNYNDSNVIGQGGYGTVYKGVLADTLVAIKRSEVVDRSQIDQFVNEVIILSQINHPNVVNLLGCCLETPVLLLVYEFVTNNTLFHHIHDEGCASSVPWDIRLRIATETVGALAHMHSDPVHIIHRDVKTANILLDDDYTAKVSDFGVSRLFSLEETHLATLVQGTFGYIDPEYFHSGILTQKSDVYSFGVVLVENLSGAKVVSFDREEKDRNLGVYFLSADEDDRLHEINCVIILGNYKKSMCLKRYCKCECYQSNVGCSVGCQWAGCKNVYGKKEDSGLSKHTAITEATNDIPEISFDQKLDIFLHSDLGIRHNMTPFTPLFSTQNAVSHQKLLWFYLHPHFNLVKAQQVMKRAADLKRKDDCFAINDMVYLKLQPYRQRTLARRPFEKLAPRFYGPFKIIQQIGKVAYKLELPSGSKIHHVFHIPRLKRSVGMATVSPMIPLQPNSELELVVEPTESVEVRQVQDGSSTRREALLKWKNSPDYEATWEDITTVQHQFPHFHLEDKVSLWGRGNVMTPQPKDWNQPNNLILL